MSPIYEYLACSLKRGYSLQCDCSQKPLTMLGDSYSVNSVSNQFEPRVAAVETLCAAGRDHISADRVPHTGTW